MRIRTQCEHCREPLRGQQARFCSRACRNTVAQAARVYGQTKLREPLGRDTYISRRYGLTRTDYEALVVDVCHVCSQVLVAGQGRLDHDHQTGVVRGVLCNKCNLGIGLLGDTTEGLRRALAYLEKVEAGAIEPSLEPDTRLALA